MNPLSLSPGRGGRAAALVAFALLSSGCTVFTDYNEETEAPRDAFERGDFQASVAGYREGLEAANDSLLYHLESGAAAHVGQMYQDSIRLFDVAYRKVEEYQTRALVDAADIAQTTGSILVNEKTLPYTGAVFEQVMLQAYQSRNYYLAGKRNDARVEVLRTYQIEQRAREIYEAELASAQESAAQNNAGVDVGGVEARMRETYTYGDLSDAEDVYDINYVHYLNAFIRESIARSAADHNEALLDIKSVAKRFGNEEFIRRDLVRLSQQAGDPSGARTLERQYGLAPIPNAGSVCLFFESGMAPRKTEVKVIFPTLHGAAAIAMPRYDAVPNPVSGAVLVLGGHEQRTIVLSNLQSIAFRYHQDRLPLLIAKQVIRLAAKIAIQEGGHAAIANNAGEDAQAWAWLYSILTSIWNVASEQADLRTWRTLPQTLQVARLYLPEGEYPARLILTGGGGNALREMDLGTITVKRGKHRMINARSVGVSLFVDVPREEYDGTAQPAQPSGPQTVTQDLRRPDAPRPERQRPTETTESHDQRRPDAPRPERQRPTETTESHDQRRPDAPARTPERQQPTETAEALDQRRPDAEPPPPARPERTETTDARQPSEDTRSPAIESGTAADPLASREEGLDGLARALRPGHEICIQLAYDHGQGEDVAMNTTVEELRDETDAEGRKLVVLTPSYDVDGVKHSFQLVVRADGIESIELLAGRGRSWRAVDRDVFWFKPIPGAQVTFEGPGRAIASRRGVLNRARGERARAQMCAYLRTYHVDGASELQY